MKNQIKTMNVNDVHGQKRFAETRSRTFLCDQGVLGALPLTSGDRFSWLRKPVEMQSGYHFALLATSCFAAQHFPIIHYNK